MAVVFNGTTRQIEITDPLIFELEAGRELYSAWKRWQQADTANAGFAPAFRTFGGDPTATGQFAPKYFFLINLWTVLIDNGNIVSVALNLYSDDFVTPYIVAAGSGVSDRNSDAVNVNEEDIKNQSFINAQVYINTNGMGTPGTLYPIGTPPQPVDNYTDGYIIGTTRNLNSFHIDGTLILGADPVASTNWVGESPITSIIVFTGQDTDGMTIQRAGIAGTMAPTATSLRVAVYQSALGNVTDFYGIAVQTAFNGIINIYNGSTTDEEVIFDYCSSAIGGNSKPELNINGMPSSVQVRHYSGGLKLTNATHADFKGSFDGQGRLEIDSTCTAGEIVVGSGWNLTDNSGVGCTVIIDPSISSGGGSWTDSEKKQLRDALGVDGDKAIARDGQLQEKSEYPNNSTINTQEIHTNDLT